MLTFYPVSLTILSLCLSVCVHVYICVYVMFLSELKFSRSVKRKLPFYPFFLHASVFPKRLGHVVCNHSIIFQIWKSTLTQYYQQIHRLHSHFTNYLNTIHIGGKKSFSFYSGSSPELHIACSPDVSWVPPIVP